MDAVKVIDEYTVEDIMNLPEGERAELIDGRWYDMATPGTTHQRLVSMLTRRIGNYIEDNNGDCQVFPAPFAVFLNEDNRNYLEPDISVICDPDKLNERGCNGAPDLVVEIVSASTEKKDYGIKLFKYRMSGVREYWIINPQTRVVNMYYFSAENEGEEGRQISFDEDLTSDIFPALTITLRDFA